MSLTRRDFLRFGCFSAGVLAFGSMVGCASTQSGATNSKGETLNDSQTEQVVPSGTAVVYFSCTETTQAIAEKIAATTDGTLMRIEPAKPYTSADLDYESNCRANAEQNSVTARPEIAQPVPDIAPYETVYLGYPIWWGTAPRIILTFLEGADCADKTIIPFCTSGSSPISGSINELHEAAPDATWLEGKRFPSSTSQSEIDSWVASN